MVQKYQNEIPPIFYYGISTKTSEKDLKIPNLQALTLGCIIKMTLYNIYNISTIYAGPHPPAGLVPAQAGEVTASTLEAGGGLHGAAGTG